MTVTTARCQQSPLISREMAGRGRLWRLGESVLSTGLGDGHRSKDRTNSLTQWPFESPRVGPRSPGHTGTSTGTGGHVVFASTVPQARGEEPGQKDHAV